MEILERGLVELREIIGAMWGKREQVEQRRVTHRETRGRRDKCG